MTTEERLEKLERELARAKRRNRHLLAFALMAAGLAVVTAAWIGTPAKVSAETGARAPKVVRATGFVLEDADGEVRATLTAFKEGSALRLFDENTNVRAALGVAKDGSRLL